MTKLKFNPLQGKEKINSYRRSSRPLLEWNRGWRKFNGDPTTNKYKSSSHWENDMWAEIITSCKECDTYGSIYFRDNPALDLVNGNIIFHKSFSEYYDEQFLCSIEKEIEDIYIKILIGQIEVNFLGS